MEKYITFAVEEHMTGQTVEKVLRTALNLTKKQISRAKFQADGIRKNGVQCRTTDIVQTSDHIMICIEAAKNDLNHLVSFCEDAHPLEILYEDEDILAVNKPAGILTHPSGAHYADTLSNQVSGYFHKKKVSCRVRPIGRLDKETSGIVLFAKNQVSAQRLQAQRESGILHKQYIAIVLGSFSDDTSASSNTAWHTVCFPIRKTADHPLRMEAITLQFTRLVDRNFKAGYRTHASDPCPHEGSRASASWRYFVSENFSGRFFIRTACISSHSPACMEDPIPASV